MMTDMQLEACLKQRRFEPPGSHLAELIIAAARARGLRPETGMLQYIREIVGTLSPRPAFALALTLALGIVIGSSLSLPQLPDNFSITSDEEAIL